MKGLKLVLFILVAVVLVTIPFLSACGEPGPEEIIELTFAAMWPSTHPHSVADQRWIDKLEEDSNGMLKITPYWSGTLINPAQGWSEMVKGVADFGFAATYAGGFPLTIAIQIFSFDCPYEYAQDIGKELFEKFPELRAEHESLKILSFVSMPSYQVFTGKTPIRSTEDFSGLIIKGTDQYKVAFDQFGAEVIAMPAPEVYVSMQKGIIDGWVMPYEALSSMKLAEVTKYCTQIDIGTCGTPYRHMNWDTWNSLPTKIQKVFEDNADFYWQEIKKEILRADDVGIAYGKDLGVEFIELSPEEKEKVYEAFEAAALIKAAELDDMGLPGTEIFKETRRLIEEYNK
jgi:TRAP-type C4-dicarboxylate transport system substrate-binding protein